MITELKDNPVPSLDKNLINKMCKILLFSDKIIYKGEDITQQIKDLQNGVETDNEQPNGCFFESGEYKSPIYLDNDDAYRAAVQYMGGDERKKDWEHVLFTEVINGSEETFVY